MNEGGYYVPYIKLTDIDMYYEELGAGEPIIFLHNAFSRGILAFSAQISVIQNKYRCILPDLRGHGRTLCDKVEWTIPQLAEDIIGLMDILKIDKVNLVGYSMGGGVALHIATKYTERIKALITIGTASFPTEGIKSNADNFKYHILENEEDKKFIDLLVSNHYDAHKGDWRSFSKTSIENWRKYPNITKDELGRIKVPAMFIAGENDNAIMKSHIEEVVSQVKNSCYKIIEECGHGPHLITEKPMLLNDIILDFLDEMN